MRAPPFLLGWLALAVLYSSATEEYSEWGQYQEFTTTESEKALFPNIFNLATNSLITATSTCGENRKEEYCKLVEHVLLRKTTVQESPQCDICHSDDSAHRHPIEYAIDGTHRFWQSPSLANGLQYERVNITIDLRQEYQVAYVIVTMGISPRPGTWVLEKSLDGINYQPWQYFATSDAECMRKFGVPATADNVQRYQSDSEVSCSSKYSTLNPLEGGKIHISLINGRPGIANQSTELQDFMRTRYVRLALMSARTLNADLMIINGHTMDKSVTQRYFYSISDISIGGQCICYGHAESCPSDPVTGQFKCECRHNTCGESCNRCCPLFNQLAWKSGNYSTPNVCQQCQCFNHADSCVYDPVVEERQRSLTPEGVFEGGGVCQNCKHNTKGINCEECKQGFFRPSGRSHYREDACQTCDCDPHGSLSDVCIADDQTASFGQHPGDCVCKPGFGGRRCEMCARGYRNYPNCEPCPCNQHGSLNYDTCEDANCRCKANVEGIYCDRCKTNTIHLSSDNPQGCQPCFCFGMTTECTQVNWSKAVISNNMGWNISDLTGGKNIRPETENSGVLMFNANQNQDRSLYYWKAPDNFRGNMLNSYGGNLHYFVYFVPVQEGNEVPVADLVIEGNGIKLEYYSRIDFRQRENMTVQIPIREGPNWYNSASRTQVDKADMMRALADVEKFMVRAIYKQYQLQSSIFGLSLDTAVPTPTPKNKKGEVEDVLEAQHIDTLMRGVEVCQCPENFAGNSCESCVSGYRRVNSQLYGGQCEKCECGGHSDQCDPFTGECFNCKHNTAGPRCELCLPGHYGNPSLEGELGSCSRCECPSAENSHSSECMMTSLIVAGAAADGEDDYVCTACETGYEGNKCEICADGYFGNPEADNGSCVECLCNGNVDLMSIGNCDTETGVCLKCIGETTGDHCEMCKEYHWGSALAHNCKACGCHHVGSTDQQCSQIDGECSCKENYIGKQCDMCTDGHGDIENDCPACDCDTKGSLSTQCDQISGQCSCKTGIFGKRCDECRPSYFNLTETGCQFCHCNEYGSQDGGKCDSITGECECRDNVAGKMCEQCEEGYFNISSGDGCQDCECNNLGSIDATCDIVSGQCTCKQGVTGIKCDKCMPNHYGLDDEGCTECDVCPAPGQVCDPESGACVCPQNTVGDMCENCTANAWDYHPLKGCKLCDCSDIGSENGKCNTANGQCVCKQGYVGLKCDRCTHGFFSFPDCKPCECDEAGTDPKQCVNGVCLCDEQGQCPCKKNAEGLKCSSCKENTFSIDTSNPLGCTDCFCFNRSDTCTQSTLVWQQLYSTDRRAVFQEPWEYYTKKHNLNVLKESPSRFNSYPTDATPLYWSLPKTMTGDRTSSYNGFLRFKIWNEDNRRGILGVRPEQQHFRYFPQVVLVGNSRIELEHIPYDISEDGKYKIRLHESQWRLRQSPELVLTRKAMMIALQNVQGVYIRGSYNYPARGDAITIEEVSLDVGVHNSEVTTGSTAIGVEQCSSCPQGYSGLSCQNPDEGYCRKRHRDYLNRADDLVLLGWSEPCQCNGHSTKCHPETCICLDCEHNTHGEWCEKCKAGYIGDGREGGSAACTKCACPSLDNSFSDSCVAVDFGRGYVCNNCKVGYTGQYCQDCQTGYFGNPQVAGGFCEECACHPDGSLNIKCNPVSGQCECRPGVTGRDCSRCQERHAFINAKCTSCDQGCYLPLMQMVDDLETTLEAQNFTKLRPIPWKRLYRNGNTTEVISAFVNSLGDKTNPKELVKDSKYTKEAFSVVEEARFQIDRMDKGALSILQFTELLEELTLNTQLTYAVAFNTTNFLKHFHQFGGSSVGGATLDSWVSEADAYLNATMERGEYIEKRLNRAQQENEKNQALLKRVFANKLNDTSFEGLKQRLDDFGNWLEEFRATIYDVAKKDTADAEKMSELVSKRLDRYREVSNEIEKYKAEAEETLTHGKDAVEQAKGQELLNLFDDARAMNLTLERASEMAEQCQNITQLYAQLIDEYDEGFVKKSEEHAVKLEIEAKQLKNSFQGTRLEAANPLRASAAYEEIVGALKNSSHAAVKALTAANEAKAETDLSAEDSKLAHIIEIKGNSSDIAGVSSDLLTEWTSGEHEKQREELDERLAFVNEQSIDLTKRNDVVRGQWSKFDDYHDRAVGLQSVARDAEKKADTVKKTSMELKDEVKMITEETEKLENSTRQGIQEEIQKMRETRIELAKAAAAIGSFGKKSAVNKERADNMQNEISLLKDRINEAREKAKQIRLSLKGDERGVCRREFISPASAAPTNSFAIRYRPARTVPNSAIIITKTKARRTATSEYIAIEISGKRVIAHWNIGSGKRQATNSHSINYIAPSDRSTWYHIEVVRSGNNMNLTVGLRESLAGEGFRARTDPVTVFVGQSEDDSDVIFNTVSGETRIGMGCKEHEKQELGVASCQFHGSVGDLRVDDVIVPLWSFANSSDECEGDIPPPVQVLKGHMFKDGFAQVQMDISEATVSSVTIVFSAYSPSGLLYFRGDHINGDFITVYMDEGHVVLKVNIGGSSTAFVESKNTYNNGREHTVRAIRQQSEIHLQVDSDADRYSATLPGENNYLNIDNADHWVGGVPSGYRIDKYKNHTINWKGFYGCILTVKPSQVTELDLDHPVRWQRKEAGCDFNADSRLAPADRMVGFPKTGYLTMKGIELSNNSTLGLSFRTREENATLLFQSSKVEKVSKRKQRNADGKGFLAVYLFRGYLVVHIGKDGTSRKEVVLFKTQNTVNDGHSHSIFIRRTLKTISVRIDDRPVGDSQTLQDETIIGAMEHVLYIGGFAPRIKPASAEIPQTTGLIGCVSDLYLNFRRVAFVPDFHDAQIGSCAAQTRIPDDLSEGEMQGGNRKDSRISHSMDRHYYAYDNTNVATEQREKSTCDSGFTGAAWDGEGAYRFGISKNVHSRINFQPNSYPNMTEFSVSLSLRTEKRDGMVWVWANYKNYTRYFYLNIIDGYATLEVKGHKQAKILKESERRLSDGHWHDIHIHKKDRTLNMKIDELPIISMPDCPSPKVMKRRMYIGGVLSKHRNTFGLDTPGFDGCIRDLKVNGAPQTLGGNSSRDVIPCAKPSKGMYVHEWGFSTFGGIQTVPKGIAKSIDISLQMRPITQEGTVLALLTNANPDAARLTVAVENDKVVISLIHAESGTSIRHILPTLHNFCDSLWHSIHINIKQKNIVIIVDGEKSEFVVDLNASVLDLFLNLPVNIGGVAGPVAEVLKTKSLDGCYRDLKFFDIPKYFEKAQKNNKIIVDGCPFQ